MKLTLVRDTCHPPPAEPSLPASVFKRIDLMHRNQILLILAVAVVAIVFGLQFTRNAELKKEVAELRSGQSRHAKRPLPRAPRLANRSREDAPAGRDGQNGKGVESRPMARPGGSAREALDAILAQPDPMHRIKALLSYAETLATDEIPGVLTALRNGTPEWDMEAKMLSHVLLTRWAREDPDAAYTSLETMNFKASGASPISILSSLAAQDPERATKWLGNPENGLTWFPWMGHILAGSIAKEWVRLEPDAAMAWAEGLPDNQRAGAYTGVLGSIAATDPQRASAIAMKLEPGGARNHIVGEVAKAWARNAPEDAVAWAGSLEGDERGKAMGQAFESWAQSRPTDAAAHLDGMAARENVDPYLDEVARNWVVREPAAAAAWVAGKPEGDGKNDAMGHVMWNWTTRDPEAATAWIAGQNPGPSRDRGIQGLAKAALTFDPEAAVTWSNEITNDKMRGESVNRGLREWRKRDAEAASAWAANNGIEVKK